jgi:hypothetical protein
LEIAQREHIDFDLEWRGILHVYRDCKSFDHAQEVNALLTEGGLDRRAVTPEEMRVIEPALRGSLLRRLLHAIRLDGRHHEVHPRPRAGLHAQRCALSLRC